MPLTKSTRGVPDVAANKTKPSRKRNKAARGRATPNHGKASTKASPLPVSGNASGNASFPRPLPSPQVETAISTGSWKAFLKEYGFTIHYLHRAYDVESLKKKFSILSGFLAGSSHLNKQPTVVSVMCGGPVEEPRLLSVSFEKECFLFDLLYIPSTADSLLDFFRAQSFVKVSHDLYADPLQNLFPRKSESGEEQCVVVYRFLDLQLVAEKLHGAGMCQPFDVAINLLAPEHQVTFADVSTLGSKWWAPETLAKSAVEAFARKSVLLLLAGRSACSLLETDQRDELERSSSKRFHSAPRLSLGARFVHINRNSFRLCSREIVPETELLSQRKLMVESEVEDIFSLLSDDLRSCFRFEPERGWMVLNDSGKHSVSHLSDIVLDLDRPAQVWLGGSRRLFLGNRELKVSDSVISRIVDGLPAFGSDNRAGLEGKLHRISALKNRTENVIGLTLRIGRCVWQNAAMMLDLLRGGNKSILILGQPGSGKTTIVRDVARILAEQDNVCIVDTSNEIAGDGNIPHRCIGHARRMMVPNLKEQGEVMVQCVQNHSVHTMIVDEIGRRAEVLAAHTTKQRGIRLVASAHGDLRSLLRNPDLNGLLGGVVNDELARKQTTANDPKLRKVQSQRQAAPVFEVVVEVERDNKHQWRITHDVATAVDSILEGRPYECEIRSREDEGRVLTSRTDLVSSL